ncbi:Os10g0515000 [Oryza sativa Japonica Group]|uniref:Os10g0515000 protein n=2 Tax=Oryza TaxID=4527 RepID=Q0IWE6_ORYSJ|nr:Os10g0515000 [Oryza sativa Japonica Group]|eukprot:NP_001065055.2 Os10g0515000 [Oryza sativa Japonica Group]
MVRLYRLFDVIFLNDRRDRVPVIISRASSRTSVHNALPCVHDHSTASYVRSAARLPRHHRLPDFGYIDHGYSTHGFSDHGSPGSFALATSTMAQRAIIRVEHSCRFILQSKCPRCSRLD